jgi:hypothetical protein
VIKNAGYGGTLTKNEIIAAMNVNYIKQQLGKPLLAGTLDGKASAAVAAAPARNGDTAAK